jgi:hypothetical protein
MANIESRKERGCCRTNIRRGAQRQRRIGLWFWVVFIIDCVE